MSEEMQVIHPTDPDVIWELGYMCPVTMDIGVITEDNKTRLRIPSSWTMSQVQERLSRLGLGAIIGIRCSVTVQSADGNDLMDDECKQIRRYIDYEVKM